MAERRWTAPSDGSLNNLFDANEAERCSTGRVPAVAPKDVARKHSVKKDGAITARTFPSLVIGCFAPGNFTKRRHAITPLRIWAGTASSQHT